MTETNTPKQCNHTHHINNSGRPMPCEAASPDSCHFKGNKHGTQEEVVLEAEDIALERNKRREERLVKKAQEKAEQQAQKETPSATPKPKPTPKPAPPSNNTPKPKPAPIPKPLGKPDAPPKPDKPKRGRTLAAGDKLVAGANGRSYVLPAPRTQEPQTEEEYLEELEKQRLFLDRARKVTTRAQKIKNPNTPPNIKRKLQREIENEKKEAEKNGLIWDVPIIEALWEQKRRVARKHGTRPHWARLTKGQRQITAEQMDEASLEKFREHVKNINPGTLQISKHVYDKLHTGDLAELSAEDIISTLNSYSPGTYSVTEHDDKRTDGRSISIRSETLVKTVAPEKGAPPEPCNLVLVLGIDPPKPQVVTAYWKAVNQRPTGSGIRFQDKWLKVT